MIDKKQFALDAIAPYYKNPSTCAYDHYKSQCFYSMEDGRMCVAGSMMLDPENFDELNIEDILSKSNQSRIFKPKAVDVLSPQEWGYLQRMHDHLANDRVFNFEDNLTKLNLFTLDELKTVAAAL